MRWLSSALLWLGGLMVGVFIGAAVRQSSIRAEAVRLGHAHYVADKDGNAVWKWREIEK